MSTLTGGKWPIFHFPTPMHYGTAEEILLMVHIRKREICSNANFMAMATQITSLLAKRE
jgi:hypothetical protein